MILYSFVKNSDLESIMKYGLMSSSALSKKESILNKIFKSEKEIKKFKNKIKKDNILQQGVSAFFQKPPSPEYLFKMDKNHLLFDDYFVLLKIDLKKLIKDSSVKIYGLELEPYNTDSEYEKNKNNIEKELSSSEIRRLSKKSAEQNWKNYKHIDGFFAPNVPHALIITKNGIIKPEYLSVDKRYSIQMDITFKKNQNKDLKFKKDKVVYHGSPKKIKEFKLKKHYLFDDEKVVFATPKKSMAICFLSNKWTDEDLDLGTEGGGPLRIRELKPGALKKAFSGVSGYIYELEGKGFSYYPQLMSQERVSKSVPKILNFEKIDDALKALEESDIKIIKYKKRASEISLIRKNSMPRQYGPLFEIGSGRRPSEEFDSEAVTQDQMGYLREECEGRVCWYGNKDRMIRVDIDYVYPIQGNIFYPDLMKRIENKIRSATADNPVKLHVGYCDIRKISISDIEEALEYEDDSEFTTNLTTGDEQVDLYLKNKEDYLSDYRSNYDEEEIKERLEEIIQNKEGDVGKYIFQVRNGNHRVFAAQNAGEKFVWLNVYQNTYDDLKSDRYGIYDDYDEIKESLGFK
jgi:hypothetical protein